ncbi:TPA: hypothetical protein ACXP62_002385 [Klebsiella variicola subsp. variicola]
MRRHSPVSLVADEKRGSTITPQAVNELIQSLESAGELSIREQKFLKLAKAFKQLAAENTYLLNGAARELNTSWMFHKTMLGAQAALACLSLGRESAARDWLEGTTDEAGAEIPDDITVAGLQAWFDSQMVSNDGKSGFLTRAEAEEAIKKACPATDRIVAEAEARGVEKGIAHLEKKFSNIGVQIMNLQWLADSLREGDGK